MERALAGILPLTRLHGLVPRACEGIHGAKTLLFLILQLGPERDPLEACGGHQGRGRWREFSWLPGHLAVLLWGVEGQEGTETPFVDQPGAAQRAALQRAFARKTDPLPTRNPPGGLRRHMGPHPLHSESPPASWP